MINKPFDGATLRQTTTVLYTVDVSREDMLTLLAPTGVDYSTTPTAELAAILAATANADDDTTDSELSGEVYAWLVENAGDSVETTDVEDWYVR